MLQAAQEEGIGVGGGGGVAGAVGG